MINLVIDIGNTFIKVALFNNTAIGETFVFEHFGVNELKRIVKREKIDRSIISSVDQEINDLEEYLKTVSTYLRFHTGASGQIVNHYKTPETLGLDRLAAVIGATAIYPNRNTLVIDAGTCITYDFIDRNRNYLGGSISPGLTMRFKAMNAFTGRLPLIELNNDFSDDHGADTCSSILSGVQHGAFNEVKGFISDYAARYPELQVILCGGDAKFFDTRLKNSIFAPSVKTEPHLVLIGLNEVIHKCNND
jgi:type III pantothenate kinase